MQSYRYPTQIKSQTRINDITLTLFTMEMHDEFDERRRGKHVVPLRCYQCMYHNLSNTGLSSATIGAISFWIGDLELGFGEKVGAGEKLLEEKKKKKKGFWKVGCRSGGGFVEEEGLYFIICFFKPVLG